jgi:hypothetical protein
VHNVLRVVRIRHRHKGRALKLSSGDVRKVVLQSAPSDKPEWVSECIDSVSEWASAIGADYVYFDDRFFDVLPDWYQSKLVGRGPILADLARLLHIKTLLAEGVDSVIWCDADTLVVDAYWRPEIPLHSRFGEEFWLQCNKAGALEVRRQPHNAFMIFSQASPVLDFLIHTTQSLIRRVDPAHIAPQMVGPKLIKALHTFADFELEPAAGAMSPLLMQALLSGDPATINVFNNALSTPPKMMNLCASLHDEPEIDVSAVRDGIRTFLMS